MISDSPGEELDVRLENQFELLARCHLDKENLPFFMLNFVQIEGPLDGHHALDLALVRRHFREVFLILGHLCIDAWISDKSHRSHNFCLDLVPIASCAEGGTDTQQKQLCHLHL